MDNYSEVEKLYSPSQWSNRIDVINIHIQFATEESEKNRQEIPCELNISYGLKEHQKFDLYGTDLPDNAPIFVYIHGGYWQELNKDISSYVVKPFYKNKFKTVVVGYTLSPKATLSEIIKEIEAAIRKCIEYAKKHRSKSIYLSGYSAGSHLIACLFSKFYPSLPKEEKSLFKATILCCGIYDVTPIIDTYINIPLKLTYDEAKLLSPMHQEISQLDFAIYVVVGEFDSPAFIKQSINYFDKFKPFCTNAKFNIIKNVDHFSIVENYNSNDYELVKFIVNMENNFK